MSNICATGGIEPIFVLFMSKSTSRVSYSAKQQELKYITSLGQIYGQTRVHERIIHVLRSAISEKLQEYSCLICSVSE